MAPDLRAPVGEMHAAAANCLTWAPELGASAPQVAAKSWPSAAATGEMHVATEVASGTLMAHLVSRADSLSASATGYTREDMAGAVPFQALDEALP
jgi:hypothetical protein